MEEKLRDVETSQLLAQEICDRIRGHKLSNTELAFAIVLEFLERHVGLSIERIDDHIVTVRSVNDDRKAEGLDMGYVKTVRVPTSGATKN